MRTSSEHYIIGSHPVTGLGLGVSESDLNQALHNDVSAIVFDDEGTDDIKTLLAGVAETEFQQDQLESLLSPDHSTENWRVGEAIAESFLTQRRDCFFPWPDGRDERKRGSCLPGADLVGFAGKDQFARFAFGEVKTSTEQNYPPGLMYGRHGLKQQMEDLRDSETIRKDLVIYLGHRANNATWKDVYQSATGAFLQNNRDVRLFGILVRDVTPDSDDLTARVTNLRINCPSGTCIELIALYLPVGKIQTLGSEIQSTRREGGEK